MINEKIKKIMNIMENIEYGYKDLNGNNIIITDPNKWDNEFDSFYKLLTPEELLKTKCGVCWDQVELERKLFEDNDIKCKTYFIFIHDHDMLPSHTFLTYETNNKHYWFEHSWNFYKGIHEYESKIDLLLDIINIFRKEHSETSKDANLYLYEYKKPKDHITCNDFYKYIETQKLIKLD